MRRQGIAIDAALEGRRPAPERRHARAPLIRRPFRAAHAGVEGLRAGGAAVVGQKHDQRTVSDAPLLQLLEHLAESRVEVFDHAVELGGLFRDLAQVVLVVFLGQHVRAVRGVQRQVGEERSAGLSLGVHPLDGLGEEQIGAVTVASFRTCRCASTRG